MSARHRTRSIITRLALFLLLGAVVNVAVAWTLAATVHVNPERRFIVFSSNSAEYGAVLHRAFGSAILRSCVEIESEEWWYLKLERVVRPMWIRDHWLGADAIHDVRGWPCFTLCSELHNTVNHQFPRFAAIDDLQLSPRKGIHATSPLDVRALPTSPIWPGFAINTFFYAAILWLLFAAPGRVRRWRRIRRGLCVKCAYPVGASDVCTECGATVRP